MPVADDEGGFSCFICRRDMAAEVRQYDVESATAATAAGTTSQPPAPRSGRWRAGGGTPRVQLG
jgi:hypothetical protein